MKENSNKLNIKVLILAAGQGKRMGAGDLPKVLVPLKGKPMVGYLIDAVKKSGVDDKPTLVVGKGAEKVKETFDDEVDYVLQEEQLGTGHAVMVSKEALSDAPNIMVLQGDHPLLSAATIRSLAEKHLAHGGPLTIGTVLTPDFESWRSEFASMAKIIRDNQGKVVKILEKEEFTFETKDIKEVNPSYFCFKANWLWANIDKLKNFQAGLNEIPLPALIQIAFKQGHEINTHVISDTKQGLGINTAENLKSIEELL